jgi:hypothetical protein
VQADLVGWLGGWFIANDISFFIRILFKLLYLVGAENEAMGYRAPLGH